MKLHQFCLGALLAVSASSFTVNLPVRAVQLADGTIAFAQPPRLVGATATQKRPTSIQLITSLSTFCQILENP